MEKKNVSAVLHEGLRSMYTEECLADVIIEVEMRKFPCHRVVLSAMSQYFRTMFTADFKDKHQPVIKLEGITSDAFQSILHYIYCSRNDSINAENVQEVHRAACMFLMSHIQEACEAFILNRLSPDNIISIWRYASQSSCENLQKFSKDFLLQNFETVVSEESFLQLTVDELSEIVSDNNLNVTGEEIVGGAILMWYKSEANSREKHLPNLFQYVKLPLADKLYVHELSKKNKIFTENAELTRLIDEAKCFHSFITKESESSSERVVHRKTSNLTNALIYICSGNSQATYAYSFLENKWIELSPLPNNHGYCYAACLYKNDLCISGGSNNDRGQIMMFCTRINKWKQLLSLNSKLYRHAMVNASDMLFLIGGQTVDSDFSREITEVNLLTEQFRTIGHLNEAVRSMEATVFGETIFILGGRSADGCKSFIQCFNIFSKQCSLVELKLPVHLTFSGAVRLDDKVLFSFKNTLCEWTPYGRKIGTIYQLPFNYQKANICTFQKKIYVHASGRTQKTQNPLHVILHNSLDITNIESKVTSPYFTMMRCTLPKHFFQQEEL